MPVLLGAATFGEGRDEGVAFVLDLTELKVAERNLRESERQFNELQMELAHASRLAAMGQLTASIAHEVKQPIGATVTNAQAALRFLDFQPVDLNEVRQIFNDIVKDGNRAGEVIDTASVILSKKRRRKGIAWRSTEPFTKSSNSPVVKR